MPYIDVKTTAKMTTDKCDAVKSALGKAISVIPGKSESWLMVGISGEEKLWFRGDNSADSAMVTVSVYGSLTDSVADKMTGAVTKILEEELNISPDRVYVKYTEHDKWGWNGNNF